MKVHYLEIVASDVEAVCAAYEAAHGIEFGSPDPLLGGARTASLPEGGSVGFWLHNKGHLVSAVTQVLSAWTQPIHHKDVPPQLAPMAFVGLGVLGMLACAKRFQVTSASEKS